MFITIITAVVFLLVATFFFRLIGDALHPAVTFPLVWGGILLLCGMAVKFGYLPIQIDALPVYYIGIIFFIFGALAANNFTLKVVKNRPNVFDINNFDYSRLVNICLILHLIMVPQSLEEIHRITAGSTDIFEIAFKLRYLSATKENVIKDFVNPIVGNYLLSGLIFMPIMFIGSFLGRLSFVKTIVVAIPWLLLNLLVSGRSGLMAFFTALVYVYFVSRRGINMKTLFLFLLGFALVIIIGAQLVGKTDAKLDDGIVVVLSASTQSFFDYTLQGPILFSRYMAEEISINPTWDALVFVSQVAEKIGLRTDEIQQHQDFAIYSSDGRDGNVYSIFLAIFPKYGYIGVAIIFCLYGFWATYHHIRSKKGISLIDRLLASYLFYAAVISFYSDSFGPTIYFFIKLIIITKVVEIVCKKKINCITHARTECTEYTL